MGWGISNLVKDIRKDVNPGCLTIKPGLSTESLSTNIENLY